jgi:hypothetical protein
MGSLRIAYLITVYKDPEQVNSLLRQLVADGHNDVYIHVDQKSIDVKRKLLKHKNIFVLDESVKVYWGDISLADALIMLLKAAVYSGKTYEFISYRSGQDLLVREGFYEYLCSNREKIFMQKNLVSKDVYSSEYTRYAVKWPELTKRLYDFRLHPFKIMRSAIFRLYKRGINIFPNPNLLPADFQLYHSRWWFTAPFEVAEYMAGFIEGKPWYYDSFRYTLSPEEFFFVTILMNSEYSDKVTGEDSCFIKGWVDSHPPIITMADIPEIDASYKFFARKFDLSVDKDVAEHYEKLITGRL